MGDAENTSPCSDDGSDHLDDHLDGPLDNLFRALQEGATAPCPPEPPDCPYCDLRQDRYPTAYTGHWILLEPRIRVPAHTVPPRLRWIVTSDGTAMNLWDAEPLPGTLCRIPHRIACPSLRPEDHWPWVTALRHHNGQRAQRLFSLPEEDLPNTG